MYRLLEAKLLLLIWLLVMVFKVSLCLPLCTMGLMALLLIFRLQQVMLVVVPLVLALEQPLVCLKKKKLN